MSHASCHRSEPGLSPALLPPELPPPQTVLTPSAVDDMLAFLNRCRRGDGGFCGRDSGPSDLYYTLFGVHARAWLGQPVDPRSILPLLDRAPAADQLDYVHACCLAVLQTVAQRPAAAATTRQRVEACRTADGGYDPNAADVATAYAGFLALAAYTAADTMPPDSQALCRALNTLRSDDGAFRNHPTAAGASVTATAAAVAQYHAVGRDLPADALRWVQDRHRADGGFGNTAAAPAADLLATATALRTLHLGAVDLTPVREACLDFVERCNSTDGGLCAAPGLPPADCEYTWYGLLAISLLAAP